MPDHTTRPPDPAAHEGEDQKSGAPPRPATEPAGGGVASHTGKTQTDPATGEDRGGSEGSEKVGR